MKMLWLSQITDVGLAEAVADVVGAARGGTIPLDADPDWLAAVVHVVVEDGPGYQSLSWGVKVLDEVGVRSGVGLEAHAWEEKREFRGRLRNAVTRLQGLVGQFRQSLVVITRDDAGIALVEDSMRDPLDFLFMKDGRGLARELLPAGLAARVGDGYPGKEREEWLASRVPPRVRDGLSVADHALIEECLGVVLAARLWEIPDPKVAAAVAAPGWHTAGIGMGVQWGRDEPDTLSRTVPAMVVLYGPGSQAQVLDFVVDIDLLYRMRDAVQVWGDLAVDQYGERFTSLKLAMYRASMTADVEYGYDEFGDRQFDPSFAYGEGRGSEIPAIVFPGGGPETVGRYQVVPLSSADTDTEEPDPETVDVVWLSQISDVSLAEVVSDLVSVVRGDISRLDMDKDWLAAVTHVELESRRGYWSRQLSLVLMDERGICFADRQESDDPLSDSAQQLLKQLKGPLAKLRELIGEFRQAFVVITGDDAGVAVLRDPGWDSLLFFFLKDAKRMARELLPAELATRIGDGYPGKERDERLAAREPSRVRDDLSEADHARIEECLNAVLAEKLWGPDREWANAARTDPTWHTAGVGLGVHWSLQMPADSLFRVSVAPALVVVFGPGSRAQILEAFPDIGLLNAAYRALIRWGDLALNQYDERFTSVKITVYRDSMTADVEYSYEAFSGRCFDTYYGDLERFGTDITAAVSPAGGPEGVGRYRVAPPPKVELPPLEDGDVWASW